MANTSSAKKAIRTSARREKINKTAKLNFRDAKKAVLKLLVKGDVAAAKKALPSAYSQIDMAVKKNVLKENTASRYKSRLAAAVKKADTTK